MSYVKSLNKIYYINLEKRTDRNEHIINEFKEAGITMEQVVRFSAINGLTHRFTEFEEWLAKDSCYYFTTARKEIISKQITEGKSFSFLPLFFQNVDIGKKVLANQLSHYYIMKEMIQKNYRVILILQDDVVFRKGFKTSLESVLKHLPPDSEIVNIGFHKSAFCAQVNEWIFDVDDDESITLCPINDYVSVIKKDVNPCSTAYLLTLEGAKQYVKFIETQGIHIPTDNEMNEYCLRKSIYYCSRRVLCTGKDFGSDIFPALKN